MYSYEERIKAVKLYVQCNLSYRVVCRELGYPSSPQSLRNWYNEYWQKRELHKCYHRPPRYSDKQRKSAVEYYFQHGRNISKTIRVLGYPCRSVLSAWIRENVPDETPRCITSSPLVHLTKEQKEQAIIELCSTRESVQAIAAKYNVSRSAIYDSARKLFGKGNIQRMSKKKPGNKTASCENVEELKHKITRLQGEVGELEQQVYRLRLEKDVLEKTAEIIKKDEGVSLENLTNHEKAVVIGALRKKYKLTDLLNTFHMAKSSYCYQQAVLKAPDKYSAIRKKIKIVFDDSRETYGYRRIKVSLEKEDISISEKVIRRIMKEDGLVISNRRRRKYSSYRGEISPPAPNIIERNFHSDRPNSKWLTDITEFGIPAGKVYLSPIVDCFDGLPVSWTIGTSPNSDMVNTMLDKAIETLGENERPIIHSDRGWHYRWLGWISKMTNAHLTRSMSKKGSSPDNAACEGFFGRLKNEMFYGKSWQGVSIEEFIRILDDYIHWYAEKRIKLSLGGMSPVQYRKKLGLIPKMS